MNGSSGCSPCENPLRHRQHEASAGDHRPLLDQTVECKSNAQSAIITGFQLSAILEKASPAKAAAPPNSHRRPSVYRFPAGSFFGGFPTPAPDTGSIARAGPASETLHESGRSRDGDRSAQVDPKADGRLTSREMTANGVG